MTLEDTMDLTELEARLTVLEDVEAIKRLKAKYCYLCDGLSDEHNREELVSLFTDDARLDFGLSPDSVYEGPEALEEFFRSVVPGAVSFCMHMVHNPIIEVSGDCAAGTWYYEAPTTDATSGAAQWMAGTYNEEYRREDGRWKIASLGTRWNYISPYADGWAKSPGVPPAASVDAGAGS